MARGKRKNEQKTFEGCERAEGAPVGCDVSDVGRPPCEELRAELGKRGKRNSCLPYRRWSTAKTIIAKQYF